MFRIKIHSCGILLISFILLLTSTATADTPIHNYYLSCETSYNKDQPIYVIGHKNPDSDTVCSAIAYANLLTKLGYPAVPVIPGKANAETRYALQKFNVPMPQIMEKADNQQFAIVDHSTYSQSLKDMTNASILAVLDHHSLGDFKVNSPIVYLALPVGSTSTIVYNQYIQTGIEISRPMAGMMLTGILSDTLGLRSPTTTEYDRNAVKKLAPLANITDYSAYTNSILTEGNNYKNMSIDEILHSDYKKFHSGNTIFSIGVVQSTDAEQLIAIKDRLDEYMDTTFKILNTDMCFIMLTNLLTMETTLLCYGDNALSTAQKAFNIRSDTILLKNTVSRKQQILPPLMTAIRHK